MSTDGQVSWASTITTTDSNTYPYPNSAQGHNHVYITDNTSGPWTTGYNTVREVLPPEIQDSKFVGYLIIEDGFVCLYNSKKNEKHKLIDLNEQKMEVDVTTLIAKLLLDGE